MSNFNFLKKEKPTLLEYKESIVKLSANKAFTKIQELLDKKDIDTEEARNIQQKVFESVS